MRPKQLRTSLLAITLTSLLSSCSFGSFPRALAQEVTPPDRGLPDGREGAGTRAVETPSPATPNPLQGGSTLGFKAPDRGLPGRREGAGTRGPCPRGNKPLTALIPTTNLGQTASAYPAFFFYVPATRSQKAEFVLLDENAPVYKTSFNITGEAGVIRINLPDTASLSPLAVGKDYKWQFSITCQPDDPNDDLFVEGWVQRVEPSPTLMQQLTRASLREKVVLSAEAGLWHESLTALAEMRNAEPNNSAIASDWMSLLQSVGLDKISSEPLVR